LKKKRMSTGVLLLLTWLLIGCTSVERKQEIPSPATHHPFQQQMETGNHVLQNHTITIATGNISGVYFSLGQSLAEIYEKYSGAVTSTQVTQATIQNTQLVIQKKAELGFATVDALTAVDKQLSSPGNHSQLRVLTGLYPGYIHIVAKKGSGIQSLEDLRGKRISVGTIGSGTEFTAERILQAANLTRYDMKKYYFSFSQSADALRNETIDAAFFLSGLPNPDIESLAREIPIILVPVPEKIVIQLQQQCGPYSKKSIPKETYNKIQEDVQTIAVNNVLFTHRDFPEEAAYELVSNLYAHLPELRNIHPAAQEIKIAEALSDIPLPFHPGAIRYFTEKGVIP
jgi:TRAP transporter TAXI family solute receptor